MISFRKRAWDGIYILTDNIEMQIKDIPEYKLREVLLAAIRKWESDFDRAVEASYGEDL